MLKYLNVRHQEITLNTSVRIAKKYEFSPHDHKTIITPDQLTTVVLNVI